MRRAVLILALLVPTTVLAQATPEPGAGAGDGRQVCEAKADQSGITGDNRDTYLRECEAGERLTRGAAPR